MTATPSKLGADMLNVPRELLQDLIDDVAEYATARSFRDLEIAWRSNLLERARALLARQPAAIDKQEAAIRDRARRFLSEFDRQTGISMSDHVQEVMLNLFLRYAAPLANEASKPVAPLVEQDERGAMRREWDKVLGFAKRIVSMLDTTDVMRSSVSGTAYDAVERAVFIRNIAQKQIESIDRAASTSANVAQGAEAVAWFIPDDNGEVYRTTGYEHERDQWRALGHAVFPLYTAPPAQTAITEQMLEKLYWTAMDNSADILKYMEEAIALTAAQSASGETK